jgi:hypothetical protein
VDHFLYVDLFLSQPTETPYTTNLLLLLFASSLVRTLFLLVLRETSLTEFSKSTQSLRKLLRELGTLRFYLSSFNDWNLICRDSAKSSSVRAYLHTVAIHITTIIHLELSQHLHTECKESFHTQYREFLFPLTIGLYMSSRELSPSLVSLCPSIHISLDTLSNSVTKQCPFSFH